MQCGFILRSRLLWTAAIGAFLFILSQGLGTALFRSPPAHESPRPRFHNHYAKHSDRFAATWIDSPPLIDELGRYAIVDYEDNIVVLVQTYECHRFEWDMHGESEVSVRFYDRRDDSKHAVSVSLEPADDRLLYFRSDGEARAFPIVDHGAKEYYEEGFEHGRDLLLDIIVPDSLDEFIAFGSRPGVEIRK